MKRIVVPLPHYGFDPTEASVPWQILRSAGHHITFATPDGDPASADTRMVTGDGLPSMLRKTLMARSADVRVYRVMESSPEFREPISWDAIDPAAFDALMLPGGHDKGMRPYLESATLQGVVAWFFDHRMPVAAICHGTLLAARSVSRDDPERAGKSVLWGRRTTGLTRNQEMIAYRLTRWKLGDYYRTYETPMMDDLVSHLRSPGDYTPGPGRPIPMGRDTDRSTRAGFTVRDGLYVSARWPGDAHAFGNAFVATLAEVPVRD